MMENSVLIRKLKVKCSQYLSCNVNKLPWSCIPIALSNKKGHPGASTESTFFYFRSIVPENRYPLLPLAVYEALKCAVKRYNQQIFLHICSGETTENLPAIFT